MKRIKGHEAYGRELEQRLPELIAEIKTGRYHALPVRRGYIPKPGKDEKRPLGIPAVEDKTVQKALTRILEPIYEQEFYAFSYGFRPGRGALGATRALHAELRKGRTHWIVEVDIRKFLETSSYYTPSDDAESKRLGWLSITLIRRPLRLPWHTCTA